jgi:hypothetical protein
MADDIATDLERMGVDRIEFFVTATIPRYLSGRS